MENKNPEWRCNCHYKHVEKLAQHDKILDKHDKSIDARVKNKLFYVLVFLVISMLGFQWVNYDKLSAIDKLFTQEIAIIKTQFSMYIEKVTPNSKEMR